MLVVAEHNKNAHWLVTSGHRNARTCQRTSYILRLTPGPAVGMQAAHYNQRSWRGRRACDVAAYAETRKLFLKPSILRT